MVLVALAQCRVLLRGPIQGSLTKRSKEATPWPVVRTRIGACMFLGSSRSH